MVHFEKGQLYSYDNIQIILNNTFDYVMKDLKKETKNMDNELDQMMFDLYSMMVLSLYKTALLNGVDKND